MLQGGGEVGPKNPDIRDPVDRLFLCFRSFTVTFCIIPAFFLYGPCCVFQLWYGLISRHSVDQRSASHVMTSQSVPRLTPSTVVDTTVSFSNKPTSWVEYQTWSLRFIFVWRYVVFPSSSCRSIVSRSTLILIRLSSGRANSSQLAEARYWYMKTRHT